MKAQERMFKALLILFAIGLLILGLSEMGKSQTVSFSPTSVPLWGQTPSITKASFEYKGFEVMGLVPYKKYNFVMPETGEYKGRSNDFNIGVFYKPITLSRGEFSATGGVGAFFQEFPTPQGSIVNFSLEVAYRINDVVSIEYEHISNGFGIQNEFNSGLDNIGVKINI